MTQPPLSRGLQRAARAHVDHLTGQIGDAAGGSEFFAKVTTITLGGARDGNALVWITYRDVERRAGGYPDSYTPVLGHRVLCTYVDSQPIILSHTVGQP